ncbi:WYL domain-containing protein [Vibrio astriarenae]
MSAKSIENYYCHQHCINLLSERKEGLTPREFLANVKEQAFYNRDSSSKESDFNWAKRILEGIYHYHGDCGDAPRDQVDIMVRSGTGMDAVYKVKDQKQLPVSTTLSDSREVIMLASENLKDKMPPSKQQILLDVFPLFSESKPRQVQTLYALKDAGYQILAPEIDKTVLKNVETALESGKPITFEYSGAQRKVDPFGLFVYGKTFFLVGYERLKSGAETKGMTGEYRTYAVHRMSDSEIHQNQNFAMRAGEDFSLEEYLASSAGKYFNGGLECEVTLKMKKNYQGLNKFVDEYKLSECQWVESEDQSHYVLKAKARECLAFKEWLMTNASHVEILSPQHIRDDVIRSLQRSISTYAA